MYCCDIIRSFIILKTNQIFGNKLFIYIFKTNAFFFVNKLTLIKSLLKSQRHSSGKVGSELIYNNFTNMY